MPWGGVRGRTFAIAGVAWVVLAAGFVAPWPVALVGVLMAGAPMAGAGPHAYRHARQHARQAVRRIRTGGSRAAPDPDGPDPLALAMGYATGGCGPGSGGRRPVRTVRRVAACPSCGTRLSDKPGHCPKCRTPV